MAKKAAGGAAVLVIAVVAVAIWWFVLRAPSNAQVISTDLATGKVPTVTYGVDNLVDVADAIATEPLTLPTSTQGAAYQ
jgi:hypothetical protein